MEGPTCSLETTHLETRSKQQASRQGRGRSWHHPAPTTGALPAALLAHLRAAGALTQHNSGLHVKRQPICPFMQPCSPRRQASACSWFQEEAAPPVPQGGRRPRRQRVFWLPRNVKADYTGTFQAANFLAICSTLAIKYPTEDVCRC